MIDVSVNNGGIPDDLNTLVIASAARQSREVGSGLDEIAALRSQ